MVVGRQAFSFGEVDVVDVGQVERMGAPGRVEAPVFVTHRMSGGRGASCLYSNGGVAVGSHCCRSLDCVIAGCGVPTLDSGE